LSFFFEAPAIGHPVRNKLMQTQAHQATAGLVATRSVAHVLGAGLLAAAVLAGVPEARAQGRGGRRVAFRTAATVAEVGLQLQVFQGAQAVGLPTPQLHTYRDTAGRIREMQDPRDFWMADQFRGRWEDPQGNRLTLLTPVGRLPNAWPRAHVLREEYTQATAGMRPPENAEEWTAWAEQIAGAQLTEPPRELQAPPRLAAARLFVFQGDAPVRRGVAFTVRPNAFGVDSDRWFFALIECAGGVDAAMLDRELTKSFLTGIAPAARPGGPPRAPTSRHPAATPPAATNATPAAALEASRQRAINSIRGMKKWWYLETPHYVIVSDLPGSQAPLVRRIQADLEPLRATFEAFVPPVAPIEAVSVLRIFNEEADYVRYVDAGMAWSGGAWVPGRGELIVRPQSGGSLRDQRAWIVETVYHEAFHQYLHYALRGRTPGVWFNEGHATFFEGAEPGAGGVTFDEVKRYAEVFDTLVREQRLALGGLFAMSYPQFYAGGGSDQQRRENYARAWGLTYFLRKYAPAAPDHPFAGMADRYHQAFVKSGDAAGALAGAMGGHTPEELEQAITEFWKSSAARRTARQYRPPPAAR
jgi:hypothetical protein